MTERSVRIASAVLASLGAAISAYILYVRETEGSLVCSTGGCETVQSSDYAEIVGIPVAVLGLAGYVGIFATALFPSEVARVTGAGLALGGLAFSVYLIFVQVFAIGAFCQWCLASDVVMALLAAAALARLRARQPAPG